MQKAKHFESHFYTPTLDGSPSQVLSPEESHHAIKVFRMRQGDSLRLTDGNGNIADANIEVASAEACRVTLISTPQFCPPPPLHLAIACLKDNDLEEVLENCAQLPLASITLLRTDHSLEPRNSDLNKTLRRLEMKALTAIKQSLGSWQTRIHGPTPILQWLSQTPHPLILCDLQGQNHISPQIADWIHNPQSDAHCQPVLLIGPEGGFSPAEISAMQQKQALSLALGPTRLRARTAPLVALATLYAQARVLG